MSLNVPWITDGGVCAAAVFGPLLPFQGAVHSGEHESLTTEFLHERHPDTSPNRRVGIAILRYAIHHRYSCEGKRKRALLAPGRPIRAPASDGSVAVRF
jgi:hypothetical protein